MATMALGPTVLLAPLLLEDADLLAFFHLADYAEHFGAGDERRARRHIARVVADEQDLVERHLAACLAGIVAVDGDHGAGFDTELAARGLDDCKHVEISRVKELSRIPHGIPRLKPR